MEQLTTATWEDIFKAEGGTIFMDKFDEGVRFIIMKGGSSLCAYIGFPVDHPLSGFGYDDLPVTAHGGLTFSSKGEGKWPEAYWWYGWDYAHSGDYCDYYDKTPLALSAYSRSNDKKWLVEDVEKDSWETIYQFKQLAKLAEQISQKITSKQQ